MIGGLPPVPDQNTSREFRETLQKAETFPALFEIFRAHLSRQGLLPRQGVIINASMSRCPDSGTPVRRAPFSKKGNPRKTGAQQTRPQGCGDPIDEQK